MSLDWFSRLAKVALLGCSAALGPQAGAQQALPTGSTQPVFLSFAQFKIPFNIESHSANLTQVQLWVSTDSGESWHMHGSASPAGKHFDFRAAAEGLYYFSVQTVDSAGAAYPSQSPPLKVWVDTTKPESAIRADVNSTGQLVIDIRVVDENLDQQTATVRMRTDRDAEWKELTLGEFSLIDGIYEGQTVVNIPSCREVALAFSVSDMANNTGEASTKFVMPRTASGDKEMTLASNRLNSTSSEPASGAATGKSSAPAIPGAIEWAPTATLGQVQPSSRKTSLVDLNAPGRLATSNSELSLRSSSMAPEPELGRPVEELPPPSPTPTLPGPGVLEHSNETAEQSSSVDTSTVGRAFHCKSRAFSLDYSVEALGGSALAEVELWGTEDGGRTWQQWGSDPDRQSPFDVQVGNDGLFGFRMVIVGANGLVSNRPKDGDSADVWINVDTSIPVAKITRAMYGEGPEDGMLVIDYSCQDGHLVDRCVTLTFSETVDGPWTTIASGLKNTGIYLWKASPNLPNRIYIRLEVVDKAGNVGEHRLDLPIDVKGLAPRGRIQGFRPIVSPAAS